jgi:hypothetical protein
VEGGIPAEAATWGPFNKLVSAILYGGNAKKAHYTFVNIRCMVFSAILSVFVGKKFIQFLDDITLRRKTS